MLSPAVPEEQKRLGANRHDQTYRAKPGNAEKKQEQDILAKQRKRVEQQLLQDHSDPLILLADAETQQTIPESPSQSLEWVTVPPLTIPQSLSGSIALEEESDLESVEEITELGLDIEEDDELLESLQPRLASLILREEDVNGDSISDYESEDDLYGGPPPPGWRAANLTRKKATELPNQNANNSRKEPLGRDDDFHQDSPIVHNSTSLLG